MEGMERNDRLDSHTTLYGVIGDPIRHSRSPVMLNQAFQEMGINAAYAAFHVLPHALKDALDGIRALGFRGVNVTVPHKVAVIDYLDEIDETARVIGAVNTIVNNQGKLCGFNTDGIGYVRSLQEEIGFSVKGKHVLLIGAGGAARGVAFALAAEGAEKVWIANRTKDKAISLASDISKYTSSSGIGIDEITDDIKNSTELIVNTTLVGMYPNIGEMPTDTSWFHPGLTVSDIVYNPLLTRFLADAETKGAVIHSGLGMFIYQAAYAFEYWTNCSAPVQVMREIALQSLTGEPTGKAQRAGSR